MSRLLVKSLIIVDTDNKKANKFVFCDEANLIVSKSSGIGKSSLVKSIYYALGANIKSFPKGWDANKYIFVSNILINDEEYVIKRKDCLISVLKGNKSKKFNDLKEYSNWIKEKMGISFELSKAKNNSTKTIYLEAILSPMYIDQDNSWDGKIFKGSFASLGMYDTSVFPKEIIDYFLGISNKNILDMKSKKNEKKEEKKSLEIKIKQIDEVYKTYKNQKQITEANPKSIDDLKEEIEYYIVETNALSKKISKKTKYIGEKKKQLDIAILDHNELKKLLKDTKNRFKKIHYMCSYCHSVLTREQSLTRLELADNEYVIQMKIIELEHEIQILNHEIEKAQQELDFFNTDYEKYYDKLNEMKNITRIREYIDQNVLTELNKLKIQQYDNYHNLEVTIKELDYEIRKLSKESAEQKEIIKTEYNKLKNEISFQIGATGLEKVEYGVYKTLKGSGTNLNKNILSIYLVYMNLLDKKSKHGFPFIIDSFVKNEADSMLSQKMFGVINDYFLKLKNQTFFSIIEENLEHIQDDYYHVQIESPLLKEEQYEEMLKEVIEMEKNE